MQVFPSDDVDIWDALDDLCSSRLIERYLHEDGRRIIFIPHFCKHQKIDKRAARRFSGGKWRKECIPPEVRRKVAEVYGASESSPAQVECYYCGQPGVIKYVHIRDGCRPILRFGCLELDHFLPELDGGVTHASNIVLACRKCNRSKGAFEDGYSFLANKLSKSGPVLVESYPDLENQSGPYDATPDPPEIPRRKTNLSQPIPPEKGGESEGKALDQGSGIRDQGAGNALAHLPSVEEVIKAGVNRLGSQVPEPFCRAYWSSKQENNRWVSNGRVIDWSTGLYGAWDGSWGNEWRKKNWGKNGSSQAIPANETEDEKMARLIRESTGRK